MTRHRFVLAALVSTVLASAAPSAAADLCLQYGGGECGISGDIGFFRFMGAKLPKNDKKAVHLHGRACGTGSVTGTAVRNVGGTLINLSAVFACDATPGVIDAEINPANTAIGGTGTGHAAYGAFNLDSGCTVTIVDCDTEPQP
jgi:hypothetical protein